MCSRVNASSPSHEIELLGVCEGPSAHPRGFGSVSYGLPIKTPLMSILSMTAIPEEFP
jgi:hypothetical protein